MSSPDVPVVTAPVCRLTLKGAGKLWFWLPFTVSIVCATTPSVADPFTGPGGGL